MEGFYGENFYGKWKQREALHVAQLHGRSLPVAVFTKMINDVGGTTRGPNFPYTRWCTCYRRRDPDALRRFPPCGFRTRGHTVAVCILEIPTFFRVLVETRRVWRRRAYVTRTGAREKCRHRRPTRRDEARAVKRLSSPRAQNIN